MSNKPRGTDVTDFKRTYRTAVDGEFSDEMDLTLVKESDLRYGENPNQPAAIYTLYGSSLAAITDVRLAKSGKGGLSATNMMDVCRGLDVVKFFKKPAVAVMKHAIPSGVAVKNQNDNILTTYTKARDADKRSAYGSIVVFNRPIDKETAQELAKKENFVEGVAAPSYEEGAMTILEKKKDLRAILFSNIEKLPKFVGDDTGGLYDLKALPTGRVIVQKPYLTSIRGVADLVVDPMVRYKDEESGQERSVVVGRNPTAQELDDMLTAWYVNIGVRSNGIVIVKDGVTLAVGSGQQERVGAVEQAIVKALQKEMDRRGIPYNPIDGALMRCHLGYNPLRSAAMSSDAFFPFRDSIDFAAKVEISSIIQPGGSNRDYEVIQAANDHNMAMVFTRERCFAHF